jgi:hypothetical protein
MLQPHVVPNLVDRAVVADAVSEDHAEAIDPLQQQVATAVVQQQRSHVQ